MNSHDLRKSFKICVKMCPKEMIDSMAGVLLFYQKTNTSLCRYDIDLGLPNYGYANSFSSPYGEIQPLSAITIESRMAKDVDQGNGPCPKFPVYPSKAVVNRCIPSNLVHLGKAVVSSVYDYLNSFDHLKQVVGDLMVSWKEILIVSGVSIVITFVTVFLIHFLADFVAWIFLVLVSLSVIALTGVMWWTFFDLKYQLDWNPYFNKLPENIRNEQTFLALTIVVTVVSLILVLICLVMRKRVKLVVALFYEAGACIRAMPGLLFQPLWTFLVLMIFLAFWLIVLLALATADYPEKKGANLNLEARRPTFLAQEVRFGQADIRYLQWLDFTDPSWVTYMWWYLIVAFFWTCEFILGCQQMVIAGAVASWYFCRDRSNLPCPVGRSIRRLAIFHMGTVALGSFLITLFIIPRLIIGFIEDKLKQYQEYAMARGMLKCCSCFLYCMEQFLRYLNRNAYTMTAIEGTGFCSSAQMAFSTISSNALRVAAINSVGDFILFLGKIIVTALTAVVATLLLKVNVLLRTLIPLRHAP